MVTGRAGADAGGLRIAVLLASSCSLLTLVLAGLMSATVATGAGILLVVASVLSAWAVSAAAHRRRHLASGVLIVMVGLLVLASAGVGSFDQPERALTLVLVAVLVIHALGLEGVRDLLVALAVTMGAALLAVGLGPGPAIAAPLLATWISVVAAFTLAHREQQGHGVAAAAGDPGAVWPSRAVVARVGGTVAVTVLMGLVAFLLVPEPTHLAGRSTVLEALGRPGGAGDGDVGSRSGASYTGSTLDLRARGELGNEPVLEVPTGSPALWRGATFDTYDGTRWTARTVVAQHLPGEPLFTLSPEIQGSEPTDGFRSDEVRTKAGFPGLVVAPGIPAWVRVDAGLERTSSGALMVHGSIDGYAVTSIPTVHDPAVLRSAFGTDLADPRWLALPVSLPSRVRDLSAAVVMGAANRHDAVLAVESYLRAAATYRLDSPVPGRGVDAVDDFLFVSRTGFCEQFAAAEVVLLRAAGISARLVTGYAYGDPVESGRLMRARNAHAWAEVWFPGIGWSASDPTAGTTLAPIAPPGGLDRAAAAVGRLFADDLRRTVLAMALLAGLLAVLAFGGALARSCARSWAGSWGRFGQARWSGPSRWGASRTGVRAQSPPLLSALHRLERALAAAGNPRHPAESLAELAARLPAVDGDAEAFGALEQDCFGAAPVGALRAQGAADAIDLLTARVRASSQPVHPARRDRRFPLRASVVGGRKRRRR